MNSVEVKIAASEVKEFAPAIVLVPTDPVRSARQFIKSNYTRDGDHTLHHHSGVFYSWDGQAYLEKDKATLRAEVYRFLDGAVNPDAQGKQQPFQPNTTKVNHVIDALQAEVNLPNSVQAPAWLAHVPDLPAHELVPCTNGLLHISDRALLPRTPLFFAHNALTFAYDVHAPEPAKWLHFLRQLWPGDPDAMRPSRTVM